MISGLILLSVLNVGFRAAASVKPHTLTPVIAEECVDADGATGPNLLTR